jgi:sec-independent protein translocase protein TatB
MFGIGGQELLVILVIAVLVVGPKNLPELARTLGKVFGQFQRAADDLKREFEEPASPPPSPGKKPEDRPPEPKAPEPGGNT